MHALALACGDVDHLTTATWFSERLATYGLSAPTPVPGVPGKDDLAPAMAELYENAPETEPRVVVIGTDGALAAVVLRLQRGDRLSRVTVGLVPVGPSELTANWGIPADPGRALDVALGGAPSPVPLLRDDSGGVLVGLGTLEPVQGVAHCDDTEVLRGRAARVEVRPDPAGLLVRVVRTGLPWKRARTARGRAFEIGCAPTTPRRDGVAHPRTVERWTWYRHTEDLRLATGGAPPRRTP